MKYICTIDDNDIKEIFTFPRTVDHDCMAEVVMRIKNSTTGQWKRLFREPISAGFVSKGGICYGESITLGLESRGEADTELLNKQYNTGT